MDTADTQDPDAMHVVQQYDSAASSNHDSDSDESETSPLLHTRKAILLKLTNLLNPQLNNDATCDRESLQGYQEFRFEAERKNFRHFLEVFAPNAPVNEISDVPRYVNDCIARCLAGVTSNSRPIFLKMPYFGPAAMEQLVQYDSKLIPGILGGSAGTTHDAFRMLWEARKYGARAALFGRKINYAEDQLLFVKMLRALADGEVSMSTAYNGRIFNAAVGEGQPFEIVWDGQILDFDLFVVPKGAPNKEEALKFITFSTDTKRLADQASWISYGPARKSSGAMVGLYSDGKTEMAPHMPTAEANLSNALVNNFEFWVDKDAELNERFNAWLAN